MSTSELRRGPGWWMDLDGQWNPPQDWPEASPPLPGWQRAADGRWMPPGEMGQRGNESASSQAESDGHPTPDSPTPTLSKRRAVEGPLDFSATTADARVDYHAARARKSALAAAMVASLTALMLAAGLVLLLVVVL